MLANNNHTTTPSSSSDHHHHHVLPPLENGVQPPPPTTHKRKRRPAGTPDPDAEVVSLSPKTLLESDRYVCEICNQGFQRDQNLQMHRRRHKVPWKLLKREIQANQVKKKVFVCPEPSCLHHDPCHALGDLVGIKKHFRRKHSSHKQWVCDKCGKGYAVQSDYKAHLKTCGTRGHSCDCGRVFSRVGSFIEHQDTCSVRHVVRPEIKALPSAATASSSRTASSTSPSSDGHFSVNNNNAPPSMPRLPVFSKPNEQPNVFLSSHEGHDGNYPSSSNHHQRQQQQEQPKEHEENHMLELKLLPSSYTQTSPRINEDENYSTHLKLSIGGSSSSCREMNTKKVEIGCWDAARLRDFASEELNLAMSEKAYAEEARREAKRQLEIAESEFANAKRIRQQAKEDLQKAQQLKEQSTKKASSAIMQITCPSCKQHFHAGVVGPPVVDETTTSSHAVPYTSRGKVGISPGPHNQKGPTSIIIF